MFDIPKLPRKTSAAYGGNLLLRWVGLVLLFPLHYAG